MLYYVCKKLLGALEGACAPMAPLDPPLDLATIDKKLSCRIQDALSINASYKRQKRNTFSERTIRGCRCTYKN